MRHSTRNASFSVHSMYETTSFDANPSHSLKTSRIFVLLIPHKSKSNIEPLRMFSM